MRPYWNKRQKCCAYAQTSWVIHRFFPSTLRNITGNFRNSIPIWDCRKWFVSVLMYFFPCVYNSCPFWVTYPFSQLLPQLTSFSMDLKESLEMPGTTSLVSGLWQLSSLRYCHGWLLLYPSSSSCSSESYGQLVNYTVLQSYSHTVVSP